MKAADYREKRKYSDSLKNRDRGLCLACRRPPVTCLCGQLKPFDPKIKFVILTHLREAQNRIGTGRFTHQILVNSEFIVGTDFSQSGSVNELIGDPKNHCVILYPGENSANLSQLGGAEQATLLPSDKKLVVFVIDGTWFTAPKILRVSHNLQALPRISFDPSVPSRFRIRKQPKAYCHSTVEAVHHVIELLGDSRGFPTQSRTHDHLLHVFDYMVEQQLEYGAREKIVCPWSPRAGAHTHIRLESMKSSGK